MQRLGQYFADADNSMPEKAVLVFPNIAKQYPPAAGKDRLDAFHVTTCKVPTDVKFQSFLTYNYNLVDDNVDESKVIAQGMRGDFEDAVQNLLHLMERARTQAAGLPTKPELQGRPLKEIKGVDDPGEWIGRDFV